MKRVLVTDAERGSAIAFVRSLARAGYDVTAAGATPLGGGFYSRHTSSRVRYPAPAANASAAAERLISAAAEGGIDLIVPVTEEVIVSLQAKRSRLPATTTIALPSDRALEMTRDKALTFELAAELDVPIPRSYTVADLGEAQAAAARLTWPVVVKPVASRVVAGERISSFNVTYAGNPGELAAAMDPLEGRSHALVQEYVAGAGHGVGMLLDEGRVVAAFQHRRLREVPYTGGPSSLRESVELDPDMYEYSRRLLAEVEWTGLAMVEFKVSRDGPRLMEINGRVWGSLPLAVRSGVDFPALLARLYLAPDTQRAQPVLHYRVGVRSRDVRLEIAWIRSILGGHARQPFAAMPSRREGIVAALRLLDPRDGYDVLDLSDPLPGLIGGGDAAWSAAVRQR